MFRNNLPSPPAAVPPACPGDLHVTTMTAVMSVAMIAMMIENTTDPIGEMEATHDEFDSLVLFSFSLCRHLAPRCFLKLSFIYSYFFP